MSIKINKSLILNNIKSHYGFNSDKDFADFLGIKPQTLSSWHSRNAFDIELIYAKCEQISADYLLTGIGDIEKTKSEENVVKKNDHINDHINDHKPNVKKMWSNTEAGNYSPALQAKEEVIAQLKEQISGLNAQIQDLKQDKERLYKDKDNWEYRYNMAQLELDRLKNVQDLGDTHAGVG